MADADNGDLPQKDGVGANALATEQKNSIIDSTNVGTTLFDVDINFLVGYLS